jgi:AraC-like DNA-binding protein
MDFLPFTGDTFTVSHEAPARYGAYRVAEADTLYAEGRSGHYFIQTIDGEGFHIQLNIFRILVAGTRLYPFVAKSCMALHFMLKGNIRCLLQGFGKALLQEGIYHLFYVPGGIRHEARFGTAQLYLSFHIELSPTFLQRLSVKYTELKEVLEKMLHHSDRGMQQHPAHITPRIRFLIDEIMRQCPVTEPEKSLFVGSVIQQLLLKYVQDKPVNLTLLSLAGATLMESIADYITVHSDYPHTIASLAHGFGLSETSLKRQFKAHTGQPVFGFIMDKRMQEAMRLLTGTSRSVRDIAMQVGYFELSNFDRAFRRKFGHSPHHYRSESGLK